MIDYNELEHHGIFGMRWGKRNGPPYPLSPEDHSASEKKAGWRKSLDNKTDEDNKSSDYINSRRTDFDNMSNEELQRLVNRLNLEKQYESIYKQDPDAELRAKVQKMQLEKQYKDLSKKEVEAGKNFLETATKTMETLSRASSSGLTLYDNYQKIKKILNG